jgi:hypothetical protein
MGRSPVLLLWPRYKTLKVSRSFSLVLVNPSSQKQYANLGQTSPLFLGDLQRDGFSVHNCLSYFKP